ncbi:MAG: SDR family NAD(P)-dependent oxidoreductase [Clostridia bacterium]|nr:SDR family NAD(P)-dependent oxidoreductase [Clostridia bacterium]
MRIAIVTGASSGIGREFALVISEKYKYDRIWLIARREDRLYETAGLMTTPAEIIPADLSDEESLHELNSKLIEEKPVIGLLVNAAGFGKFGSVESQNTEDIADMIDVNIKALTLITRMCLPFIAPNGAIINMASASAFLPLPFMNVYSATKSYVLDFTRALADEIKNSGVSVTAVCPYWVNTEFIPVAKDSPQGDSINNFLFITYPFNVVKKALEDNENDFLYSYPNVVPLAIKILSLVLPESMQIGIWNKIRHIRNLRYNQQFPEQLPLL